MGAIGVLHAGVGFLLGPFGLWMAWRFDASVLSGPEFNASVERALEGVPEAERSKFDIVQFQHIVDSRPFRLILSGLAGFGILFNGIQVFLCSRLIRARRDEVRAFVVLMVVYAAYTHLLPKLLSGESELAQSFSAAWGVGNMGLSILLFTYYWLWGPLLAVLGSIRVETKNGQP